MAYPDCGMVHIKEPLLLIGKSNPCGGSGFPLSLSEWSFTICPMPYNCNKNVLSASLNKTFTPFLHFTSESCCFLIHTFLLADQFHFTVCKIHKNKNIHKLIFDYLAEIVTNHTQ